MTNDLVIERISDANFDDFISLIRKLAEYEKLPGPDEDAKLRLKRDGISENPKYYAYLVSLNGTAIGYIIYFMTYSSFLALPTLFLEDIFLLEEHRRKGYGQQMFNFCVREATRRNCGRVEWTVLTWNEPAIKFYEKNKASRLGWYFYRLTREDFVRY